MNRSVYAIITLTGNVTLMFTYLHFSMQKDIGLLALGAWLLTTAIFNFIASRQRLLHTGRPDWLMALFLIPGINIAFILFLLFAPGQSAQTTRP